MIKIILEKHIETNTEFSGFLENIKKEAVEEQTEETPLQISYLNLWDIFRFIFRQLGMTFFHKVMVTEKNNFS